MPHPFSSLRAEIEQWFKEFCASVLDSFIRDKGEVALPEHPKRILVVRQHDQLGDMLLVVPLLRALKHRFPAASISLVASCVNYEIMRHNPFLDEVIKYDKFAFQKSPVALPNFVSTLRGGCFDIALVPVTVSLSFTSDMLALLSSAPVRIGVSRLGGISNQSAFCFTSRIELDWTAQPHLHQSIRNLDLISRFGISESDHSTIIGLTAEENEAAQGEIVRTKGDRKIAIGFHPGAGKLGNRWPAERFAAVANSLAKEHGAAIYITSGSMDAEPVEAMKSALNCEYQLIERRGIREVAALINAMDLFISNDTGIMHIAGALNPDLVAIFGRTDPLQWAPVGEKNQWIRAVDGNIAAISTQEVLEKAREALQRRAK